MVAGLLLTACSAPSPGDGQADSKIKVVASFYPYAYMAERIGGEFSSIDTVVRPGIEPHDFEPKPQDVVGLNQARVFFFNGARLEPWADKLYDELIAKKVSVFRMSDHVPLRMEGDVSDPHFWLDPVIMQKVAEVMRDAYIQVDAGHTADYQKNAASLIADLQKLDASFKSGLASCERRDSIVSHGAYMYLAVRYNFTLRAIAGISPDAEPTSRQLAELADFVKKQKIPYIFFEDLVSSKLSDTLAKEAGVQTLVLHPIEGLSSVQRDQGMDYMSLMNENLTNLRKAMTCK